MKELSFGLYEVLLRQEDRGMTNTFAETNAWSDSGAT